MIDVLVVGAGPYGLSVAAHAQALGLRTRIIGTPMHFWDNRMPVGMFLKSEPFASSLGSPHPGRSFLDRHSEWDTMGRPIPLDMFTSYGRWFAEHLAPGPEETLVTNVAQDEGGYRVTLATEEVVRARTVVVAIGVGAFAHTPDVVSHLSPRALTHASEHRDLGVFADRDVIVVGAGQSAIETAVLLADAGARPRLVARTPRLAWNAPPRQSSSRLDTLLRGPHSGLGRGWRTWVWSEAPQVTRLLPQGARLELVRTTLGPAGSWWLRDRMDERVTVNLHQHLSGATEADGKVMVSTLGPNGPQIHSADHVIAATGYRPQLDRVTVLSPDLRQRLRRVAGSPRLDANFQASVPGLYFTGLSAAASFGPVMRFVHGADFCARRVARHIALHAGTRDTAVPKPVTV
ncbi:NAD(P)-binding domain-containing protein [Actinomadura namibiensis]|uniref:Cation diffusion facilitator CzcD-associated flavoprotein CzcO n=1 Tax=Actinomadura namibiensis TaxID=182080 RepID=A0A7W3LLD1_ACTNM|nr:NAD(P)-binding domain-containing protein [Actinomadura namibiensis]MBA8950254.1 cation diffusion facilitator CzcD-associated flavoprotein CzcO [Actinomadura namibiensis]